MITRQIATLVHSSLPVEEALAAVGEQTENPRIKSMVMGVRAKVMEGHTLADGLAGFPKAFPELYRATVAAGEQSGHLDTVLERLADYTEGRQELRQKVLNAMIYPIVLTVLATGIVTLMLVYVVPKVVGVFANTGQELPGLTSALIALSDFLRDYGLVVAARTGHRHLDPQSLPEEPRGRGANGTCICCACRSSAASSEASIQRVSRARLAF